MCRKAHGAAFATAVGVSAEGFRLVEGKDAITRYASSDVVVRPFCSRCGSPVPDADASGDQVILNAGTLDDDPGVRLGAHIFVASKAAWHEITDGVACFEAYPPGIDNPVVERAVADAPAEGVVRGSCQCGGAGFEIRGEIPEILNCHCSRCRKAHAAAHSSILRLAPGQLRWVRGENLRQTFEVPGAFAFKHCFCRVCGSSLPQDHPGLTGVHAGLLDDDPGVRAGLHIWVGSKAPWFEISDELPQFPEYR
jgi:hypothetical protein